MLLLIGLALFLHPRCFCLALELQVQVDEKSTAIMMTLLKEIPVSKNRDNPTDCETINEFGRRKTFVEVPEILYSVS